MPRETRPPSGTERSAETPAALTHLEDELRALEAQGLRRTRPPVYRGARPSFCSNDYLGLASTQDGFVDAGGAGASRLVSGEADAHHDLERALAEWLGASAALLFPSGYAANVGVLSSLVRPGELVVSDALNHASIIDGCRLAKATVAVVPHLDVGATEQALAEHARQHPARPAWVVTESYFGMDADVPDLAALRAACDRHRAGLIVDEAHAFGVLGPEGRGLVAEAGIDADVRIGTLGKAFGRQGAFVAGSHVLIDWLWNRARSFVFSTGLSPALARAGLWAVDHAAAHPELRERCLANAVALRSRLGAIALGMGPIVPLVTGTPERTLTIAAEARAAGIHVLAIRPPTVPTGTSRLRLTVTARHSDDDIEAAASVLRDLLKRFT